MKIASISNIILALILLISAPLQAAEKSDSIAQQRAINNTQFKPKQLILPAALIAVGASSLFLSPMEELDHSLNRSFQELRGKNNRIQLDEYLRFAPLAANYVLHFSGVKSGYNTRDQLLLTATSYAAMYALTQGLKHTVDKTRPDGSDNHSFPSGHVATAFLSAEQLRMNYGTWWGMAGYTFATGTAFLRLYNNRHWLGDVIGAAGIGILSARIGYWLLPLEKRLLKHDSNENNSSLVAVPTVDTYNKTYGLAMAIQF